MWVCRAMWVTATMPSIMAAWASCGRPGDDIADGVEARLGGFHILIDMNETAFELGFGFLQAAIVSHGFAADGE